MISIEKQTCVETKCKILPQYGPLEINCLREYLNEAKKLVANEFNNNTETEGSMNIGELEKVRTIGVGTFGTVLQMKDAKGDHYAVKAISKKHLVRTKQVKHVLTEKKILSVMNFPFIVHLIAFSSDNSYLYFVLPLISGGDLFSLLKKFGRLEEGKARFYTAQIALAFEYLHFVDLIYRDLKPENVLVDHTGYLKLTDFGFGKYLKTRTWTLCGTPEYIAPEIVLGQCYNKSVDWWAFGVLIFELVSGRSPFFSNNHLKVYKNILDTKYVFPPNVSVECKSLISNLLQPSISLRYGSLKNGVDDIKQHVWYRPIEWNALLNRRIDPPYLPPNSETNFEPCRDVNLAVSQTERFEKEFEDF